MKNKILSIIIFIILSSSQGVLSQNQIDWWNDKWSFRQEITIPIDTSLEEAKFQPIDIRIKFDSECWAKDEEQHSLRVILQDNEKVIELESQIYDLNYLDDSTIHECSLVFLIPKEASGEEQYFVYYDDEEKASPDYEDHTDIEEGFYHYEPIPGYPFESSYFKVTQDGYITYLIAFGGEFLGFSTAHQITKLLDGVTQVSTPKTADSWASFDYFYYYDTGPEDFASTIDKTISKKIIVDGNLMVKFGIVSETLKEDFRTTGTYKYYHCPIEDKRISAHVIHEALKKTYGLEEVGSIGNIGGIQCGEMKSPSIDELNFGSTYPYMHIYSEENVIQEYDIDEDPDYVPEGIQILQIEDDVDLGEKAWISFDKGETGGGHGLIFDSTNILVSGTDERDGIQVGALEGGGPGLLGLETNLMSFYLSRNSVEKGEAVDTVVPADFVAEYNAEFFTTKNGGYLAFDKEADMFQSLVKIRPLQREEINDVEEEEGELTLTTLIHMAPTLPMASTWCIITGLRIPYLTAELYKENELTSTGIGARVSTESLPDFEETKIFEKIKIAIGFFDLKNATLFKSVRFDKLHPGNYLVKIFMENPVIGKERKFIGFKSVELKEDKKIRIFAKPECDLTVELSDQNNKFVENAAVYLLSNDEIIWEEVTDKKGQVMVKAPADLIEKYLLKIVYNGFIVHEQSVRFGYLKSITHPKTLIEIERHDVNIKISDTWDLAPEISYKPTVTSNEMEEEIIIQGEETHPGNYLLSNLYPGTYKLEIKHKSFKLEENIQVPTKEDLRFVFPVEHNIKTSVYDLRGGKISNIKIVIEREGKIVSETTDGNGHSDFLLPPGTYTATVFKDDIEIGRRKINVIDERDLDLVTLEAPIWPYAGLAVIIGLLIVGSVLCYKKKDYESILKLTVVALAVIAIFSPWWMMLGSNTSSEVESATSLYFIPQAQVKLISTPTVTSGSVTPLPEIAALGVLLLTLAIIIGCISILSNIIFTKNGRNRLMKISYLFGLICFSGTVLLFYFAISQLAKIGVGSFAGAGSIEISIIGEGTKEILSSNWGGSYGFYSLIIAVIILLLMGFYQIIKRFRTKRE